MTYHRRYWLNNKAHLTEIRRKWNKKHKKHLQMLAHLQYLKDKPKVIARSKTKKYKIAHKRWYKVEYLKKRQYLTMYPNSVAKKIQIEAYTKAAKAARSGVCKCRPAELLNCCAEDIAAAIERLKDGERSEN